MELLTALTLTDIELEPEAVRATLQYRDAYKRVRPPSTSEPGVRCTYANMTYGSHGKAIRRPGWTKGDKELRRRALSKRFKGAIGRAQTRFLVYIRPRQTDVLGARPKDSLAFLVRVHSCSTRSVQGELWNPSNNSPLIGKLRQR